MPLDTSQKLPSVLQTIAAGSSIELRALRMSHAPLTHTILPATESNAQRKRHCGNKAIRKKKAPVERSDSVKSSEIALATVS